MKRLRLNSINKYINVQKIAGLFFILLILTAYTITFKDNTTFAAQKQKFMSVITNQQEKGISTLAITSLPFWLALTDRFTAEDK